MYPHYRSLMPNLPWKIILPVGAFSLGCYRGARAEYPSGEDLIGYRVAHSLMNGFIYTSPFGIPHLFNIINRADVAWNHRDKSLYPNIYKEPSGYKNYRVI